MRRTSAQWPPRNEKATDRQGKISHLLRLILDNCDTLNEWERKFVDKMGALINRRRGIEPSTALSEKQARKLRQIIFKKHRDYKHAVPKLPAGVKFEDEVRRLLKSQPNPNEARNELIRKAKEILDNREEDAEYLHDWPHNYRKSLKFVSLKGTKVRLKEVVMYVEKFDVSDETPVTQIWEIDTERETVTAVDSDTGELRQNPNDLIQKADEVVYDHLLWEGEDGYDGEKMWTDHKFVRMEGDKFVFEISWEGYVSNYPEKETWTSTVKVDPTTRTITKVDYEGREYREYVVEPHPMPQEFRRR